jgi:hypothetical protein
VRQNANLPFIGVRCTTRIPLLVFRSSWFGLAGQVPGTSWRRFTVPSQRQYRRLQASLPYSCGSHSGVVGFRCGGIEEPKVAAVPSRQCYPQKKSNTKMDLSESAKMRQATKIARMPRCQFGESPEAAKALTTKHPRTGKGFRVRAVVRAFTNTCPGEFKFVNATADSAQQPRFPLRRHKAHVIRVGVQAAIKCSSCLRTRKDHTIHCTASISEIMSNRP